jgi:eukaryotic-like serine/threonine-protein kinase
VEGREADARSDIFALGAVLYEMASGKRAFTGKSQASIVAAILASDPQPISAIQPMSPPALDRVVRTCMAKDPDERWQTAHDVKLQLQWIAEAGSQAGIPAPVAARRRISQQLAWAIAGVAIAAAIVFGVGFVLRAPEPVHPLRVSILPPDQHSFDALSIALSPDGTKLAFVASASGGAPQLWVRPLDSTAAQPLAGTDDAAFPFWSPDSHSLGFFAEGKLKTTDASGGAVQTLADATQPRGGAWGADGTILFTPDPRSGMLRIPAAGGTPSTATGGATDNVGSPRWPVFLPDGKHFLFFQFARGSQGGEGSIHLSALDSKQDTTLVKSDYRAQYGNGHLVFVRGGNLLSQKFDEKGLKLTGDAVPIAEQVRGDQQRWGAAFSLSNDGKLIFAGGQATSLDLAWYDRSGKNMTTIDTGIFQDAHISHDGKKVSAARVDAGGHLEIYIYDLTRGTKSQFSFSQSRDDDAVWSPDGNTIVFDSARSGRIDLYTRPADGAREEELLYHDDLDKYPFCWSLDGKYIAYEAASNARYEIWAMPMFGDHKPFAFIHEKYSNRYPAFSPDTRWMAYTSVEAGHPQVYIVAFPTPGGRFLVGDGLLPAWNRNGKEILYVDDHSRVASVEVTAHGDSVELGKPKVLFPVQAGNTPFEVSPDGQRLLMIQQPGHDSPNLTLVVNWPQELKK